MIFVPEGYYLSAIIEKGKEKIGVNKYYLAFNKKI